MITNPLQASATIQSKTPVRKVEVGIKEFDLSTQTEVVVEGIRSEEDRSELNEVIGKFVGANEQGVRINDSSYIIYRPIGEVIEPNGTQHHILAHNGKTVELLVLYPGRDEQRSFGTVHTIDKVELINSGVGMNVNMYGIGDSDEWCER